MEHTLTRYFIEARPHVLAGEWDQCEPNYWMGGPCCVGAKLAKWLLASSFIDIPHSYLDGLDTFAKKLGGNRAHLIYMVSEAGVDCLNPFGGVSWKISREEVWDYLIKNFETLPDLCGVNLMEADLVNVDLTGTNFENTNFYKAKLWGADFTDTNLTGAKFCSNALDNKTITKNSTFGGVK